MRERPDREGYGEGSGYGEWNGEVHYAFLHGESAGFGLYNNLNKKANTMEYGHVDRLPGELSYGHADAHFHPMEPFEGRLTIAKIF